MSCIKKILFVVLLLSAGGSWAYMPSSAFVPAATIASDLTSNSTVQVIGHPVIYGGAQFTLNGAAVDITDKSVNYYFLDTLGVTPDKVNNIDEATLITPLYQWQSSTNGTEWKNITGATAANYQIQKTDIGSYLHVVMTPVTSNDFPLQGTVYTSVKTFNQVAPGFHPTRLFVVIKNVAGNEYGVNVKPKVGISSQGTHTADSNDNVLNAHVYTAEDGSGTQYPDSDFTFQWYVGTTEIPGATNVTYIPLDNQQGKTLRVRAKTTVSLSRLIPSAKIN